MREKGEELELQIIVQEIQLTRGVREGDAGGQLARDLLRCALEQLHQKSGGRDPQLAFHAADAQSQEEQQRESGEMLRAGWFGVAVCDICRSRGSHHPHCCPCW